ncbi:DNA starvation/stationary phase protection protein [Pseudanabaena sp. FACHB-1998]|uniref:Dps family protein n=1 Tax=Pseudanabaena sp. FACHB-1998 TaxID=2692858 RepID=UPI001680D854|nr:Dps family protein [Pseudanabaena sp. FACHB-1998]MBD2178608.1 DNA starvation/stationary phase protection protein [Pseudanabaena sp. FACHB-1998]
MKNINIGLTETQRQGVIDLLNNDLADSYLLLVKTKKYHWDVVGPQFMTLHKLWQAHYEALTINVDAIAERIRMLGGYPVGTMEGFLKICSLKEHAGKIPTTTEMVSYLLDDHEKVIRNLRDHIEKCSEKYKDDGTADFLTGLMGQHEEIAWMLRSFIEGESLESNGAKPEPNKKTVGV